ncbi:hypothetical protein ACFOY4_24185 [Actinomadura syzygii]|uniref:Uncharacterized protein n=1 Tax=Actinomadura syzygii TaxID=1427538 RepID=A0A5D0ULG8_9ACTN|nr:hypothetical protein [Actinomadura syzygii]TYC18472.1 hypothetical protein FXF65_01540 [Actinomadura syzygii]
MSTARRARERGRRTGPQCADEAALAMTLTTVWMVRTGRLLDRKPIMHELSADELVEFWDDPLRETVTKARVFPS